MYKQLLAREATAAKWNPPSPIGGSGPTAPTDFFEAALDTAAFPSVPAPAPAAVQATPAPAAPRAPVVRAAAPKSALGSARKAAPKAGGLGAKKLTVAVRAHPIQMVQVERHISSFRHFGTATAGLPCCVLLAPSSLFVVRGRFILFSISYPPAPD